jgi:hypothetical protein
MKRKELIKTRNKQFKLPGESFAKLFKVPTGFNIQLFFASPLRCGPKLEKVLMDFVLRFPF